MIQKANLKALCAVSANLTVLFLGTALGSHNIITLTFNVLTAIFFWKLTVDTEILLLNYD